MNHLKTQLPRDDEADDGARRYVKVAVTTRIANSLIYASDDLPEYCAGFLVKVPIGSRVQVGLVLGTAEQSELQRISLSKVRKIAEVFPIATKLSDELRRLILWSARYYHHPLGLVVKAALPAKLIKPSVKFPKKTIWSINSEIDTDLLARNKRYKKRLQLYEFIKSSGDVAETELLKHGFSKKLLRLMSEDDYLHFSQQDDVQESAVLFKRGFTANDNATALTKHAVVLTDEQNTAVDLVQNSFGSFQVHILEGVTGSGKTEVYIRSAESSLNRNESVLVLVPEIGLIEQTKRRFSEHFHLESMTYHSDLSDAEKFRVWRSANLSSQVIIGTRSAIFLPMLNLGLIVIDEEHDQAYKQQEGFRYSARDLAMVRAKNLDIPVLLGSATPSIDTIKSSLDGHFKKIPLHLRVGTKPLPEWKIIDGSGYGFSEKKLIHPEILAAMNSELARKNQVLVYLNRRGYAPKLTCTHCGWSADCPTCDKPMTYHRGPERLLCHRCNHEQRMIRECIQCKSTSFATVGIGTQQLESMMKKLFPSGQVIRFDRDSTQGKGGFQREMEKLSSEEPAVILGTQMLTKGHHLPRISLVIVLDSDAALMSFDFKAQEHLSQALVQVAGRAGRGDTPGRILVQTRQADHPFYHQIARLKYADIAASILSARKASNMPPYSRMAVFRVESTKLEQCKEVINFAKNRISHCTKVDLIASLPCATEKRNNRYRFQLILSSNSRGHLHQALAQLDNLNQLFKIPSSVRCIVDVDPYTLD